MILGTKEWMPNNENCIEGCENDCLYCYASLKAAQYKRRTRDQWHEMKPNARSKRPVRFLKGGVMFPTTHDIHARHIHWWGPFLHRLLEAGNDVLIVTKPECEAVRYICNTYENPFWRDHIEFRFTIGTYDDRVAEYWEPHAPKPSERLLALSYALSKGFKCSISMEPLLVEQPKEMINALFMGRVTGEIWIGMMNHIKLNSTIPEQARQIKIQSRENLQRVYDSLKDNPQIRWKDSVRDLLGVPA